MSLTEGHPLAKYLYALILITGTVLAFFSLGAINQAAAHTATNNNPNVFTTKKSSSRTAKASSAEGNVVSGVSFDAGELTVLDLCCATPATDVNQLYLKGTGSNDDIDINVTNGDQSTMEVTISINNQAPELNYNHGRGSGNHTHLNVSGSADGYGCHVYTRYIKCVLEETRYSYYDYEAMIYVDGGSESSVYNDDSVSVTGESDAVKELKYLYVYTDTGEDSGEDDISVDVANPTSGTPLLDVYLNPGGRIDHVGFLGTADSWNVNLQDRSRDVIDSVGTRHGTENITLDEWDTREPLESIVRDSNLRPAGS